MKNGIIAILSAALVFFVLYALGAFEFASLSEKAEHEVFAKKRNLAVAAAKEFCVGGVFDFSEPEDRAALDGFREAAEKINAAGGIAGGKKLVLEIYDSRGDAAEVRFRLQEFCERDEVALCVGATDSAQAPALRAIAQLHALPLISPLAAENSALAPLSPDTFVSFFPSLGLWTTALVSEMKKREHANVLVVSPGTQNYGGIFASHWENALSVSGHFSEVFRVNFSSPARADELAGRMKFFTENRGFDAIAFTGTLSDFAVFSEILNLLEITLPVYGTDELDVPGAAEIARECRLHLIVPDDFSSRGNADSNIGDDVLWRFYGAAIPRALHAALVRNGNVYDAGTLADEMRKIRDEGRASGNSETAIRIVDFDFSGDEKTEERK